MAKGTPHRKDGGPGNAGGRAPPVTGSAKRDGQTCGGGGGCAETKLTDKQKNAGNILRSKSNCNGNIGNFFLFSILFFFF